MARPKLQKRRSSRWREIERRFGMPMQRLLPEMFSLHGGRVETTKAIGIDPVTLDRWLRVCGFEVAYQVRTTLVPAGPTVAKVERASGGLRLFNKGHL